MSKTQALEEAHELPQALDHHSRACRGFFLTVRKAGWQRPAPRVPNNAGGRGDCMDHQLNTCPRGKAPLTHKLAKKRARKASAAYNRPMAAYQCQECGAWHIGNRFSGKRHPGPLPILNTTHQFSGVRP